MWSHHREGFYVRICLLNQARQVTSLPVSTNASILPQGNRVSFSGRTPEFPSGVAGEVYTVLLWYLTACGSLFCCSFV